MPHCNKKMLSFFLTTKCNLCCRYCYNAEERASLRETTLPLQIAEKAIDWYFENQPYRHIRFYGPGEPTQEFELMKAITNYARNSQKAGGKITVELQTNGIFKADVRNWLLDNADIIWFSFDGMRSIQDYYRPINPIYSFDYGFRTSGEVIEDNVKWLLDNKNDRNLMVGVRATITDDNLNRQSEMVDYFASLGIKYIWNDPIFNTVREKPACCDPLRQQQRINLDKYIEQYLIAKDYAERKGIFYGSFLSVNFDGESEYHCRACDPLSAPHITPDGYISACDMVLMGKAPYHMEPLVVGKYEDNHFIIDEEKIKSLFLRKASNMEHCIECPAKLHCGGFCLGETLNETGYLNGQDVNKCDAIKKLFSILGECKPYKYLHP